MTNEEQQKLRETIQTKLAKLGLYSFKVDGIFGPLTLAGINILCDRELKFEEPIISVVKPVVTPPPETTSIIPAAWMPNAKMSRVILHWTAGAHSASSVDRERYHIVIEGDGTPVRCDHSIDDNENTGDDDYAAHTRGCNTGSIGVSLCCMENARERPFEAGKYPMTQTQWVAGVRAIATLCKRYGIPVTDKTVLSHAEVQANLGIKQNGKWDVAILPFDTSFNTARKCGDRLRAEVLEAVR